MSDGNRGRTNYPGEYPRDYPTSSGVQGQMLLAEYPGTAGPRSPILFGCTQNWPPPSPTIAITNLNHGDKIALTNERFITPQPRDNQRAPSNRRLIVTGTAAGTNSRTEVNGRWVDVVNGSWRAEFPIEQLGPFCIRAGGGNRCTIIVHIFSIEIVQPRENEVIPIVASLPVGPPNVPVQARINGLPQQLVGTSQFTLRLDIGGFYRVRTLARAGSGIPENPRWESYRDSVVGQAVWPGPWDLRGPVVIGGWGKLTIEANILNVGRVISDPRWVDIQGVNPSRDSVLQFIDQNGGPDKEIIKKIVCHESHFEQFRREPCGTGREYHDRDHEPPDDRHPNPNPRSPNPRGNRPLFGGLPAGIGLGQRDPANFPAEHWNWEENLRGTIREYNQHAQGANQLTQSEQERLNTERTESQALVNQNRSLQQPPQQAITIPPITVPGLTPEQLRREKIRRYNGNRNYRFDVHYVVTNDGLNYQQQGTQQWVEEPGRWEDLQHWRNRGGVRVRRNWVPGPAARRDYVSRVEACNPGG